MASRKKYLDQESQKEMNACTVLGSTSAPLILELNGLEAEWASFEHKRNKKGEIVGRGRDVSVRGQDVFSLITWMGGESNERDPRNFLKHTGYRDADLISLTEWEDRLTDEYYDFLIDHFTDRYANLDGEGKAWLYKVVRLAVMYHIMRNKVTGYMTALATGVMEEDYICNPFAAFCYQLVQGVKLSGSDVARKVNFIVAKRPALEALEEQIKSLENDPEAAYRQDELSNLRVQLKTMKDADRDYRQQLIGEFVDAHFKRIADVIKGIAKIANIPEFHQLASELSREDDDNAATSGVLV